MASTASLPASEDARAEVGANQIHGINSPAQEDLEWWMVFKFAVQLEPQDLRKFMGFMKDHREMKQKYHKLIEENNQCKDELLQCRTTFVAEDKKLRQEIAKLKEEFRTIEWQNTHLQQEIQEQGSTYSQIEALMATPRKRRRIPDNRDDDEYLPVTPGRQAQAKKSHSGVSRPQIKDVLGGSDRGWGSMKSWPEVQAGDKYTHHTLLDVGYHLFNRIPSTGKDITKAVLGFGKINADIVSGSVVFPLFVRSPSGKDGASFTYLGNYTAVELGPLPWGELSEAGKQCVAETTQKQGLPSDCDHYRAISLKDDIEHICHLFSEGTYQVPHCRLVFQGFDWDLKARIQESLGRQRFRS